MMSSTITISENGQIFIPKDMVESLHWVPGTKLDLLKTKSGILLQPKFSKPKLPAKNLKGFLQHSGSPIPLEQLCKPVEYPDDRI